MTCAAVPDRSKREGRGKRCRAEDSLKSTVAARTTCSAATEAWRSSRPKPLLLSMETLIAPMPQHADTCKSPRGQLEQRRSLTYAC